MSDLSQLLQNNKEWAAQVARDHPDFFPKLAAQHAPQHLWIGCSDARVPANVIVDMAPGELFVHRNVANVVLSDDLNLMSVLEFAVEAVGVSHIIVCGHYRCYGVEAAVRGEAPARAKAWLDKVRKIADRHAGALRGYGDEAAMLRRLCELNVIEQAATVCRTDVMQKAWENDLAITVHAWIYAVEDGIIRELGFQVAGPEEVEPSYAAAVAGGAETPPLTPS